MGRAGQRVKLECEAKGNPMPTLTWYHDGKLVEETMNVKVNFLFMVVCKLSYKCEQEKTDEKL